MIESPPSTLIQVQSSSSKLPLILVGLILMLTAGAGGVYLGKYLYGPKTSQPALSGTPTQTPSLESAVTPIQDQMVKWKLYRNEIYGYELKHPQEWKEIVDPKSENREFTLQSPQKELVHAVVFDLVGDSNQDNDYRKTFSLSRNKSLLITYVECDGPGCGFGKLDLQTFNQILSTFKFLDGAIPTLATTSQGKRLTYALPAGWKTAQNSARTIEIGYDSQVTEPSTAYMPQGISAVGRWESNPARKMSGNYTAVIGDYDGGSRHTNLLSRHLGLTDEEITSGDWKYQGYYFEKEYLYNGWSCLVLFGFSVSQTPGIQGICPINTSHAIYFSADSSYNDKALDIAKLERYLQTVRLPE